MALIEFRYASNGNGLLPSDWSPFSGSLAAGEMSEEIRFRVYNNYVVSGSIRDAYQFALLLSALSGTYVAHNYGDKVAHFAARNEAIQIKCVESSELSGVDPEEDWTYIRFGAPYSGASYDVISASGSYNYNEYLIRINIASGADLGINGSASGTSHFSAVWDTVEAVAS